MRSELLDCLKLNLCWPSLAVKLGGVAGPPATLKANLLVTDIGFISYWFVSVVSLLPADWLYKDAGNPILMAWNWSFAPIDLIASCLGLASMALARKGHDTWRPLALLSMSMTFCAGLMAISFWALRKDFDLSWWLPNLYLVIWPIIFAPTLIRAK